MKQFYTIIICLVSAAGVYARSTELLQKERKLAAVHGNARTDLLNELAWGYRRIDPGKSRNFAERAEKSAGSSGYLKGLAYSHKNLGFICGLQGENTAAEAYLFRSLKEFRSVHNRTEMGNLENLLGLHFWEMGNYPVAVAHYHLADSIYTLLNDTEGKAAVLSNLGIISYERGRFEEALNYYLKALKNTDRDDFAMLSNVYTNIGIVYKELNNYPKAIEYHRKSMELDLKTGNRSGLAKSLTNLAECYFELKQYDQALDYTKRGMEFYRSAGEKKGEERSLLTIAHIELRKGNFPKAKESIGAALRIGKSIDDKIGVVIGLSALSSMQIDAGERTEALKNLQSAKELADRLHSEKYQQAVNLLLAKAFEQSGDADNALHFYRLSESYREMAGDHPENTMAELEIFLETKTLKSRIEALHRKSEQNARNKKIAVIAGIVLTLLAGLILASQRSRLLRKQGKIQAALLNERNKRKSLASNLSEIERDYEQKKRALYLFLHQSPEKPDSSDPPPHREKIEQLGSSRILTEEDWQEFRNRFNGLFPDFFSKLKEHSPDITTAEIRLAALLKLELSTREISSALAISSDSVKKSRQRLRKKLRLSVAGNLESFIRSF